MNAKLAFTTLLVALLLVSLSVLLSPVLTIAAPPPLTHTSTSTIATSTAKTATPLSKNNNQKNAIDSLVAAPDLIVESIVYSPTNPAVSQGTTITVTVKNQGGEAASGFYVHLYIDPADEPPISTTTYTSRTYWGVPLNPGSSFKWVRTNQTFAVSGTHRIYAWVDRDNQIAESNENNNQKSVNIFVGSSSGADGYEPDNTCAQASSITTDGAEQLHNLYPVPDQDWVKFSATAGVLYRVQALADGADADLSIELYSTCDGEPSFGSGAEFEFTPPADGTYYLKIEHTQDTYGSDTTYRLKVTTQNNCAGFYEPNDTCNMAKDIAVNGVSQTHNFCRKDDTDWSRFPVQAGSVYRISASNIGADANAQLSLYGNCQEVSFGSGQQHIDFPASYNGFVFVKIENQPGTLYGSNTEYHLQVSRINGCNTDAFEMDDTPVDASTLNLGGTGQTHNICPAGDVDWAKFQATAGLTYTMETLNLGSKGDTKMCLYNADGTTRLICDDDNGAGYGSRITWVAPSTGNYMLRVQHYDAGMAGDDTQYDLRVFTGICQTDHYETDNSRSEASSITVDGSTRDHNFCPKGDVDWTSFDISTPGNYIIETVNLGVEADTVIELYDTAGNFIASNDDGDNGTASRLYHNFSTAGTYYVKVRPYNAFRYGSGTKYSLKIYPGTPTPPTATPTPTLTPTATPTPPPSQVQTIILYNRDRTAALYGSATADQLTNKLYALARHTQVKGDVILLNNNATVKSAYTDWVSHLNDVDKANQVSAAIRSLIMNYLQQHKDVKYIVLVGDDRLLPFRRVIDNTPNEKFREHRYAKADSNNPTGAALQANYFLSDDYYADRQPTPFNERELYIPDLAIGRLIESPTEIMAFIDNFLLSPVTTVNKALITGYDFVQDVGSGNCQDWQANIGNNQVDCTLIGSMWSANDYRNKQLHASPPFKIQSINGHANHYMEGVPNQNEQSINATEIAGATSDLSGALIYTLGCHSGLNVPPSNTLGPIDLAQAFAQKKANYVANTGYGWGGHGQIVLSEKLIRFYNQELVKSSSSDVAIGDALKIAKQRYYQQHQKFTGYDEKILEELTLYGLPMYRLHTGTNRAVSTGNDFPSVDLTANLPGSFGNETVMSGTINIQLTGALGADQVMTKVDDNDGSYYTLDGHYHATTGQPVQPLFFIDITSGGQTARSVVFRGGSYEALSNFNPLILSPVNDYLTQTTEISLDADNGWFPATPLGLQNQEDYSNLVVQMGQYNTGSQEARLYNDMQVDLYYSTSSDRNAPEITVVDGLYDQNTGEVEVKVGAIDDASGIQTVIVVYNDPSNLMEKSLSLHFDTDMHKWVGSFPGTPTTDYWVQAIDGAGNKTEATNKGVHFTPGEKPAEGSFHTVYLPLVIK